MFGKRLISGVILVILAMLIVGIGGDLLCLTTALISLIGLFELYRVMKLEKRACAWIGYGMTILYYLLLWKWDASDLFLWLVIGMMLWMALYVFTFPKYKTDEIAICFFGVFYVSVLLSYLYRVRIMTDGFYLVWLIVLSAWGCDTSAYCFGVTLGKHKLAPVLSPKKSIEGAIGGVFGAALLAFLYATVLGDRMQGLGNPQLTCTIACAVAAVISQIGDLAASAIKRDHNIKDYGTLIPGHGGVLDRFDSMLFTAPAIYMMILLLQ